MATRFGTRLKQAAAFVAIVWGVAATFVAFDVLALKGMDLAVAYQSLFGNLLLSSTTTGSTTCVVGTEDAADATSAPGSQRDAHAGAWLLGMGVGRDAVLRQYSTDAEALAQFAASLSEFAESLGVSSPGVFVPEQIANANTEFVGFVEADTEGTAHQLAVRYAPQLCQIYKMGALWGYSAIVRSALPGERAVFGLEIQHYARQAGVPEPLWQPMLEPTPRDATPEQLQTDTTSLTNGVTKYFADAP